jgi:hypothetical protein
VLLERRLWIRGWRIGAQPLRRWNLPVGFPGGPLFRQGLSLRESLVEQYC